MLVLGIETSCDETAAALVLDGRHILSNVVASQVEAHRRYGGIVPEIASRQHLLQVLPVVREALERAGIGLDRVEAVAVTRGPGLAGSLMVGVNVAKAMAFALGVPLCGVNHLEGHIYAAWLDARDPEEEPGFPLLCLVASGGHTDLILMEGHGVYRLLGRTRDDAAGEAFDKAARLLGLGYPGGPAIQQVAQGVEPQESLPRAWMRGTLDFSFSGLKTALLHQVQGAPTASGPRHAPSHDRVRSLAAAFQESVVEVLVAKTLEAAAHVRARGVVLVGGVAANAMLRQQMQASHRGLPVLIPPPPLCTDNAAMIAACAFFRLRRGERDSWDLDVTPALRLG
ncbi:MAG: tRNA (adenosine(37)-N6)-threonylcarbamoyltransferase complex transferase subunit TsaD [Chloroflexi bacterium]|nr:tRNA (adenosine(37)-N6)-threonylcarbamoyltransferase complex transferase subunit TsaD [Chloroflexota bacterium]